jgi:starch synthase
MKKVLMLASENGALEGAKVGGIADVIRDLPVALANQGLMSEVVMPSYGFLPAQTNAKHLGDISVRFRGQKEQLGIFRSEGSSHFTLPCYFIDHPNWHTQQGELYHDSGKRPFAEDANTFALFCKAVAEALIRDLIPLPDVIHLHDWHASFLNIFRCFDDNYKVLKDIPTVMSIHNLAIQGVRPLQDDESSLAAWFPDLYHHLSPEQFADIIDPRYPHCINPMRAGINLSDRVQVVSPTYAKEVLKPSRPEQGFFGGEGLEQDLINKGKQLYGILNGCNYPPKKGSKSKPRQVADFIKLSHVTLDKWLIQHPENASYTLAKTRLEQLDSSGVEPDFLLTSVGRLTNQKMLILRQPYEGFQSVLDALLHQLSAYSDNALFIMVGSGDKVIAEEFTDQAQRHNNFLFLNGYADKLPDWLYQNGDLFLMPSSFEPCGISQMLALREGQPCLLHGVGGLKDTVEDKKSGFVFEGDDLAEQAQNLLRSLDEALSIFGSEDWQRMRRSARARRFSWAKVSKQMIRQLYQLN